MVINFSKNCKTEHGKVVMGELLYILRLVDINQPKSIILASINNRS